MRACRTCGKQKPLAQFPSYVVRGKRGRRRVCKTCWNAQWSPIVQQHNARYYHENRAGYRDRQKARTAVRHLAEHGLHAIRNALYSHRHPDREKAKQAVAVAVRSGRLSRLPCQVCGATRAQAHHDDYTRRLDVIWLCATHHGEMHRLLNRRTPASEWPTEWPDDLRVQEWPS